jgi:hypothetical protein
LFVVLLDHIPNSSQFQAVEPSTALETNWVEPILRDPVIPLHMDMMRFITISGIEEEPIWSRSHNSRHFAPHSSSISLAPLFNLADVSSIGIEDGSDQVLGKIRIPINSPGFCGLPVCVDPIRTSSTDPPEGSS